MISLIINTAADAPHAKHVLSSGKVPYSWRAYALQNFIIPHSLDNPGIDEVIVAGQWHEGDTYGYVPVKPVHFNWADCLLQRQAGFEAASGDILIFQHDDHILDHFLPEDLNYLLNVDCADVISCERYTYARGEWEELNNGSDDGYIDGHCAIYRRPVIERCPWKDVPVTFTMDVEHTKQIRAAGFSITFNGISVRDVEYGATPWR